MRSCDHCSAGCCCLYVSHTCSMSLLTAASGNGFGMLSNRRPMSCSQYSKTRNTLQHNTAQTSIYFLLCQVASRQTCKHARTYASCSERCTRWLQLLDMLTCPTWSQSQHASAAQGSWTCRSEGYGALEQTSPAYLQMLFLVSVSKHR